LKRQTTRIYFSEIHSARLVLPCHNSGCFFQLGLWGKLQRSGYFVVNQSTYYSCAFVFFVGIVFTTGVFLFQYRGYDVADRRVSKTVGIGALVLVFFPCKFEAAETRNAMMLPQDVTNILHLAGALVFFGALIFMILFQFTKTPELKPTGRKLARNILYVACGIIITISLVIGFGSNALYKWQYSVYLGEWAALWSFSLAYLTKGGLILQDV